MTQALLKRGARATVIIPSLDGHREGCVPRLLQSLERQTFRDFEVKVIRGVSPQGCAINRGAAEAVGEYLIIMDDDSLPADEHVLQGLLETIEADPSIGMAGASIVLSPDASAFQKRAARQFPRFNTPTVDEVIDSDMACHGCCVISKKVFEEIGGEREDLLRGLDPDLRVRLRNAGYRVVLAPRTRIYHPLPEGWKRLLKIFFRNGFGSAYAQKFRPDTVFDTHERLKSEGFQPRRHIAYRVARYPLRLIRALMGAKFMRFGAYCSYACGYVWGLVSAREEAVKVRSSTDMNSSSPSIKWRIKTGAKRAALELSGRRRANGGLSRDVQCGRILTYHSIGSRSHEMNVTTEAFRRQMEWLAETQNVVSVSDVVRGISGVAVTFDDGYRDNLINAAPVLNELGLPATVFVITGKMGGVLGSSRDADLDRIMSIEEVRSLHALGIEIGAHTRTHARLSYLTEDAQRDEIVGSCAQLSDVLGCRVKGFAYPYGSSLDFNDTSRRLARESGCEYALSNRYGVNAQDQDPFALRRITVDASDTFELFQAKVDGRLDVLWCLDSLVGIRARRTLNLFLGTRR